ncbi:MAG: F0F1 ATP synthase subunit B [Candidatus Margulisbacteria bacterium]|nr:F0F1 ATP synthase subunit B [Candidatus Margulisiibacteriota bacterium]
MVEINPYELIMQIINFGLLLFLLKKFLYKPMKNFLDKRAEDIQSEYDNAENLKKESEVALSLAKEEMEKAKVDAKVFIENTLASAQNEKQKMIEDAENKVKNMLNAGKQGLESEIRKAKKELKSQIANISVDIASRIIEKEITEADHDRLIKNHIYELSELK